MKKSLLALAVLGTFAGVASAQTAVTMYGIADAGLVFERGNPAGSVTKLGSGISAGSRLGFRGTEDLGGGLKAVFTLETGFNLDTGGNAQGASAANPGGILFGRQTFVGLQGAFGSVTLGRQYNPYFKTVAFIADPFVAGQVGNSGNIIAFTGANGRTNNSILYSSPTFGGFSGELMYGFGEVAGSASDASVINFAIQWANGPFAIRLGHNRQDNDNLPIPGGAEDARNTILAGSWDFKVAKIHAAYAVARGQLSISNPAEIVGFNRAAGIPFRPAPLLLHLTDADVRDYLIGATVPFGPHKILASYIRRNDRTAANQDANQFAIGYEYSMSKRTTLYTAFSRISNRNGAGYTVGNSGDLTAGSGDRGLSLGIRHTF